MKLGLFGLAILVIAFSSGDAKAQQVVVSPAPVVAPADATYSGVTIGGGFRTRGGVVISGSYAPVMVAPAYATLSTPLVPTSPSVVAGPVVVQSPPVVSLGVGVVPVYRPGFYPYYGRPYARYYRR